MKRRSFITGLGTLAGVGGLTVGSGAFTEVDVERSVSVAVVDDDMSYLTLTERGDGARSIVDGGKLKFSIPGVFEDNYPNGSETEPEGVGTDSVYRFGRDAAGDEVGLFGISNRGTDPVEIYSTQYRTAGVPSVTIFNAETGSLLTKSSPSASLGVGKQLLCGLEVDTHGVSIDQDEYDVDIQIHGDKSTP